MIVFTTFANLKKRAMNIKFIYITLFLCNIAAVSQEQLRYNLVEGETYTIEQTANQEITMELEGSKHIMNNTISGDYEFKILENRNDTIILESTFIRMKFKTESNLAGVLMDVDTNEKIDEEDIMGNVFKGIINIPVTVFMLPTGKVARITGTNAMIESTIGSMGIEDSFTKNLIKKSIEKEFGDESLASSIEQMTYLFSSEKVNINDTWNNTYTGNLDSQNTWKLTAYEAESFTVNGKSKVTMNTDEESISMNLTGTQETEAHIEVKTGFLTQINVTQEAKGNSVLKTMNNIEVPTSLTATMTYKRI